MRKDYTQILKTNFQKNLFQNRTSLGISQEEMAHRLSMASRTYVDLEHGKSGCSALTLAFYLIYICPDSQAFLDELKDGFENVDLRRKAV